MSNAESNKYHISLRILHAAMAIMIMLLLGIGLYMTRAEAWDLYPWHKAFGITALALLVIRMITRIFTYTPPLPKEISRFERVLSNLGHYALYGFMAALPISGYIMSDAGGRPIKWFFDITLPSIFEKNTDISSFAHSMHTYGGYALAVFLVLHIAGAFKHYIFDKHNLFKRIFWG